MTEREGKREIPSVDEVLKDKEPNEDKLVENQYFEGSGSEKGGDDKKKKVEKYIPPLPFPQCLRKVNMDKRKMKFFNLIKQLNISIPLLDALTQIPSYAKFLKDVLSNKRKFEEQATVAMSEEPSAIIQSKLPPKLKDPGRFSIPCVIRGTVVSEALCDLGASVSLIPFSLCKKLQLGDPKSINMTIQLADHSVKHPVGILEDISVKIDKYFIPTDFVVLDIEEHENIPIILGRPFLATTGAVIDVKKGTLRIEVADEKIEFNIFHKAKDHSCVRECIRVDVSEESIVDCTLLNLFSNEVHNVGDDTLSKSTKHKKKKLKVMGFGKMHGFKHRR
ncbi:uncharacterized protein LOC116033044 [Ipomoea triloba]|uniref:uncharacterized protein LOC116033044 n=1 Tax=Ipomoea triloba TaxID=35885 RepID=UPI00125D3554|nr:uncharacterized protein LOC116033044 [Ipomoea triloba]